MNDCDEKKVKDKESTYTKKKNAERKVNNCKKQQSASNILFYAVYEDIHFDMAVVK